MNNRLLRYKAALLTQLLRAEAQGAQRTVNTIRSTVDTLNIKLAA